MVDKIEMSLDDIIKSTRGRGRKTVGSNRAVGGIRRGANQAGQRRGFGRRAGAAATTTTTSPRKTGGIIKARGAGGIQKARFSRGDVNSAWKHDMYDGPKRGILKTTDSAKLVVSNLDYGVSDSDIKELFTEFGPLKKAAVHYDRSGRSLGTADVVFERRSDAVKAIKQYNGVPLDGRPMNIQFLTDASSVATRPPVRNTDSIPVKRRQPIGGTNRRGGATGGSRGRGGGGGGGGRNSAKSGTPRVAKPSVTAEELDAELDAYVNDMKI